MTIERHTDHYAEPWFWECFDRGVHPREAEADDILGPPIEKMQYRDETSVRRVILESELGDMDSGDAITIADIGKALYGSGDDVVETVVDEAFAITVLASLTKTEALVVGCILDGSGTSSGYAIRIGERLGMTPQAVRVHWSSAKRKLKKDWAA